MKATELRIGNIVNTMNGFQSVMGIDTSDERGEYVIFNDGRKFGHYIEHYGEPLIEPIPLTEEWLERFGAIRYRSGFILNIAPFFDFGYVMEYYEWRGDWAFGILYYDPARECDIDEIYNFNISGSVKYVHQLQNLYFALTGEELELKP